MTRATSASNATRSLAPSISFDDFHALLHLQADYARVLDANQWERWPDFFIDDCEYRIVPRENFERGFPLATLAFSSKGALLDRVYGIRETLFHDPYYQRHVVGAPVIQRVGDDSIECESNYAVFRTKLDGPSTVFNVGRYLDRVVRTTDGLKFASRVCVFDSEMIPNAIIYPI